MLQSVDVTIRRCKQEAPPSAHRERGWRAAVGASRSVPGYGPGEESDWDDDYSRDEERVQPRMPLRCVQGGKPTSSCPAASERQRPCQAGGSGAGGDDCRRCTGTARRDRVGSPGAVPRASLFPATRRGGARTPPNGHIDLGARPGEIRKLLDLRTLCERHEARRNRANQTTLTERVAADRPPSQSCRCPRSEGREAQTRRRGQ